MLAIRSDYTAAAPLFRHDLGKAVWVEPGAADQGPVDVDLRKELRGIRRLDASPVDDTAPFAGVLAKCLDQTRPDMGMCFLRLVGCGSATGADGPDGLVCDHQHRDPCLAETGQTGLELTIQDGQGLVRLALLQHLTDTHDRRQPVLERSGDLLVNLFVGFTKDVPSLGSVR